MKDQGPPNLRRYIDQWVEGHFLGKLPEAERQPQASANGAERAPPRRRRFLIDPHKREERSETWQAFVPVRNAGSRLCYRHPEQARLEVIEAVIERHAQVDRADAGLDR